MEPPATSSAPEPTEPSTVTSPSGKKIDCPERTGSSKRSVVGFGRGSALGAAFGVSTASIVVAVPRLGRTTGAGHGGVGILEAHDADAAVVQFSHQMRDRRLAELHGGQVEDNWRADKKGPRALDPLFYVCDPIDKWWLGRKDYGHIGSTDEARRLPGLNNGHHGPSQFSMIFRATRASSRRFSCGNVIRLP